VEIYDPIAAPAKNLIEAGTRGITRDRAADRLQSPSGRTRQLLTAVQAHGVLKAFGLESLALESRDSTQPGNSVIARLRE
jgi:hypothetical protein